MKCNKIREWMYLYTEQELSKDEEGKLSVHLKNCPSCSAIFDSLKRKGVFIEKLNAFQPELTYPEILTSNIMQSIARAEKANTKLNLGNKLLDIILSYKIRIVAFTIVAGLVSLFAYQQVLIMNKLNRMEEKIAIQAKENEESVKPPSMANSKLLKELVVYNENEQIILDKQSLDQLLREYKNLRTDHDELLKLLNTNLRKLEKKLSKSDIQKLKKLLQENGIDKKLTIKL